jgi:3',5'-nucleoside bisphosphate phosphatase
MTKWLLADLHIHSNFSDGLLSIEEIVETYGKSGFDVIAITDHLFDTESQRSLELHEEGKSVTNIKAYFDKIEEVACWAKEDYDLLVLPGLEICNIPRDYHILGIDLKEMINPNQDAEGVIEEIHRQGGLAIASHPHLKLSFFLHGDQTSIKRHPLHLWKFRERYADKIDAWEIANRDDLFEVVGLERFPYLANSDFHERHHLTAWKSLILAEKEKESIKKAIKEKKVALFFFKDCTGPNEPPLLEQMFHDTAPLEETIEKPREARVLIADDERDLVEMLAYNLQKKEYEVLKAYDGYDAWYQIESEEPDLLILDLMMPGIDGWELCRLIRGSQKPKMKEMGILMLTARAMEEDRVYGLKLGADDYLTKPFSISELILRIEKIVEKKKAFTELQKETGCLRFEIKGKEENLRKVVHDLKTPILSMGFLAKLALRDQNGQRLKFLNGIYESSVQLTQWVDSILNYDEISKRKMKPEMKEIEISSLIKEVLDLLKGAGEEKQIQIIFSLPPSLPPLRCDEQPLKRALNNLISNALKYTPRGGKVEVSVIHYDSGGDGGIVEIAVKDTGIGILGEDIARIFEPFYRGKNVDTETGIGLGLSFVKEVVDLHGGKILLESEPGKGSNFSVLLPIKGDPICGEVKKMLK